MGHRKFFKWRHRLYASRGVRAHSPFIYRMSLKVFEPSFPDPVWKKLEKSWNDCFGENLSRKQRKKGYLLSKFSRYFEIKKITILGNASVSDLLYLSLSKSEPHINLLSEHSFTEPCIQKVMKQLNVKNINKIFDNKLLTDTESNLFIADMLFVSADYPVNKIIQYFEKFIKYANNNSVFILDNVYLSKERILMWKQIKRHEKVTVTIDLYSISIIFFRKESSKEDFIIRY